jgi:uncharacterized protein
MIPLSFSGPWIMRRIPAAGLLLTPTSAAPIMWPSLDRLRPARSAFVRRASEGLHSKAAAGSDMHTVRLKRLLLNWTRLRRGQLLRPLRHRLRDKRLWSFEHHSVAKGAALGVFFAILFPFAHVLLASVAAIALRANVVVAALTTFISNPLTLPILYYAAYRVGTFITEAAEGTPVEALASAEQAAEAALNLHTWLPFLVDWLSSVGAPTAIGIVTLSCASAMIVYALVIGVWGAWARIVRPSADALARRF